MGVLWDAWRMGERKRDIAAEAIRLLILRWKERARILDGGTQ